MSTLNTVRRNTAFNAAARVAMLLVWVGVTPQALARLGPERFGFWAVLLLIGGALTIIDLGLGAAVVTYTARVRAEGGTREVRRTVGRALRVYLLLAAGLVTAAIAATPLVLAIFHVPGSWADEASMAYRLAVAAFAVAAVGNVFQGALVGLQRLDLTSGATVVLSPLLLAGAIAGLASPGPLVGLVAAQLGFNLVLSVVFLAMFLRQSSRTGSPGPEGNVSVVAPAASAMLRFGALVQLAALAGFFHLQLDKILIGNMIGLASVAPYELGFRVSNGIAMLPTLSLAAFTPAAAEHDVRTGGGGREILYRRAILPYLCVVVPLCVAPAVLARPLLEAWLGAPQPDAEIALRLLIASVGLTLLTGIATSMARALGQPLLEGLYGVLALVLHLGLGILGIRLVGWVGALVGGLVAVFLATAWFLSAAQRRLGLPVLSSTLAVLGRVALPALCASAAAMFSLQPWHGAAGRRGALLELLVGAAAFIVVFVTMLCLFYPAARTELTEACLRTRAR